MHFTTISPCREDKFTCKYIWVECCFFFVFFNPFILLPLLLSGALALFSESECQHLFQARLDSWREQRSPHRARTIKGLDCSEREGEGGREGGSEGGREGGMESEGRLKKRGELRQN